MTRNKWHRPKQFPLFLVAAGLWCCVPLSSAYAAEQEIDYFEMSLEELAFEYQTAVSGSRQAQAMNELSVPITVISAEDIHASGLTNIPEVLQFYTSMDVIRLDRNRYAVGVRGLHDEISERTLTLINGRNAASVVYGGSEYYRYPILMEDIDRIEIVRGPGGAAWGANAFTGVVNIITKKPADVQGYSTHATLNEYGDVYTHLRAGGQSNQWAWRTSLGYESKESSDRAGAGTYTAIVPPALYSLIGYPYQANDFSRDWRFDSEAVYTLSDNQSLETGLAYAHDTMGSFEMSGYRPQINSRLETLRPYVRWNQVFSDQVQGYVQCYLNYQDTNIPAQWEYKTLETDVEAQFNFNIWENHETAVGSNVRWWRIDPLYIPAGTTGLRFTKAPFDEQQAGIFVIDRWQMAQRWTVEGQGRLDYYSETDLDWSARGTVLYALDAEHHHVLRTSIARAIRTPMSALRNTVFRRVPVASFYLFNFNGSPNLENEKTWSVETGYTGKLSQTLALLVNTYYQRFEDMIGYTRTTTFPLGPSVPITTATTANLDAADTYGLEVELEKTFAYATLCAWYAYNGMNADNLGQFRAAAPAANKLGLRGRTKIGADWTLNANYRYTDTTRGLNGSASHLHHFRNTHRLDIALLKGFHEKRGEFLVGISDLFNQTNGPNLGSSDLTGHETPGCTVFARLFYEFH